MPQCFKNQIFPPKKNLHENIQYVSFPLCKLLSISPNTYAFSVLSLLTFSNSLKNLPHLYILNLYTSSGTNLNMMFSEKSSHILIILSLYHA